MDVLMFGPPGAGKGTQGKILARGLAAAHLSTGDMLRAEIAGNTALGRAAAEYALIGQLVPDDLVIQLVMRQLTFASSTAAVFDGFPRTEVQAIALDAMLGVLGRRVDHVICLRVPRVESERRMLARGREDDVPATVQRRLLDTRNQSARIESRYASVLRPIDATLPVDDVARAIEVAIGPR